MVNINVRVLMDEYQEAHGLADRSDDGFPGRYVQSGDAPEGRAGKGA